MRKSPGALPPISYLYLLWAVLGAVVCWTFNILAYRQLGRMFTPREFVTAGFEVSALHSSIAADFWIGSSASLIWMIVEGRRQRMARVWLYVVVTFVIAWSCALPLFLWARERNLPREQASRTG
jgi:drug/metabolite transporter (DMT)-like permease